MRTAIVSKLVSKDETRRSYQIQVIKVDSGIESDRFIIPVVDVRDGVPERGFVNTSIKASNPASKYMHPSFSVIGKSYQSSQNKELK